MPTLDQFALGLQGLGAGLSGQGSQFQQIQLQRQRDEEAQKLRQQKQNRQLSTERRQALLQDNRIVLGHLSSGNVDRAKSLLDNRLGLLAQDPNADPSDTQALQSLINSGDIQGAIRQGQAVDREAVVRGLLPEPTDASGKVADRSLRERQIAVSESAEKRQASKLSAGLEGALLEAQDRVVLAQRNANEYSVLASDFERLNLEGGVKSTFSETLKGVLGTQDDVTEFRRRFNKVRLSEGLKNLPPGPATDRDVQEAFKGVPKENASPEQVASFLRGAARLSRFEAGYNQFKADFIADNRSGAGLNRAWRGSVQSPALKRKVSIAEIYETAQNRGITPEEVKSQLGIQ